MKPLTILQVAFLAILALTFVPACSSTGTRSDASSTSRSNFTAKTRIEVDELEVKPVMNSNILKIKTGLDAGQLTFRLFKPAGDVQWEKTLATPANYQQTFNLDVTPGIWKLEIELENASGNYDIQWKASN
jgi:hypothetical protein